jgi:nitrite reductase/ring-hydroxylating ferredoxin subunit
MALPGRLALRTAPPGPATGWYPVARSAEVGTAPVPVGAGDRAYVVVRLRPGAEVTGFSPRCPHRLVPLAAGTVVDGRLQCPFHGWRFDAEGRCVEIPSLGTDGVAPPRADLGAPWAVEERDGWVWVAPDRTSSLRPPRLGGAVPQPEPVPAPPRPVGPVLGNLDPALDSAWHPVARADEVREGGYAQVRLLGRTWTVHRTGGQLSSVPPAWGVQERLGLIWLAPAEPADVPLDVPEDGDPRAVGAWLPGLRSSAPAGPLADVLLDGTRATSVPAGTAPGPLAVSETRLEREAGGFTGVRDEWSGPGSPDGGGRLLRRTTSVHRAPFQLMTRVEERDAGTVRTLLVLLQPEDADSTRVHTRVLLRGAGGAGVPPGALATAVAAQKAVLAEDLALSALLTGSGLPLLMRDELHVPADRLGVALRLALADFVAAAGARLRASA